MLDNYRFAVLTCTAPFLLDLRVSRLKVLSRWISMSFSLYATLFQLRCKVTYFLRKTYRMRFFFS